MSDNASRKTQENKADVFESRNDIMQYLANLQKQYSSLVENLAKTSRNMYIITVILLIIIVISIIFIEYVKKENNLSDSLYNIIVLFIGGLAGYIFIVVGLKRLEQIDSEINSIRRDIMIDLHFEKNHAAQERNNFRLEVKRLLDKFEKDNEERVNQILANKARESVEQAFSNTISRLIKEVGPELLKSEEFNNMINNRINNEIKEVYNNLLSREAEESHSGDNLPPSLEVAHKELVKIDSPNRKRDYAEFVYKHFKSSNIPGDQADIHNFASELARLGIYDIATKFLIIGLKRFPNDVDLLSDIIKFLSAVGNCEDANDYFNQLKQVPYDSWNWRAFVFSGDFLEACGRQEESEQLYREFRRRIPHDERAYSQPAVRLKDLGRLKQAQAILERCVEGPRRASQCAALLAEIYVEQREYEKALHIINRAIESNAEEQPSSNQSAQIWRRATILDSIAHSKIDNWDQLPEEELNRLRNYVLAAIDDYSLAIELPDAIHVFRAQGPIRMQILCKLAKRLGISDRELPAACDKPLLGVGVPAGLPPEKLIGKLLESFRDESE